MEWKERVLRGVVGGVRTRGVGVEREGGGLEWGRAWGGEGKTLHDKSYVHM
jgi:hypothetical protein